MPRVDGSFGEDVQVQHLGEPVPAGLYTVRVTTAELKTAEKSGAAMVALELEIEGDEKFQGRKLFTNWVLTSDKGEKSQKFLDGLNKGRLEAFGCPHDGRGFDSDDLIGLKAAAKVGIREYTDAAGQVKLVNEVGDCTHL